MIYILKKESEKNIANIIVDHYKFFPVQVDCELFLIDV